MLTRKEKRNREKNQNYFFDLLKIQRHFFKDFITKLKKVKDPRHQSYITYETETMLYTALLKNIIGIDTMRNMTVQFNTDECIENVKTALSIDELEELPHYDT
ncbi:transposase family protein, partial [Bacillaceae bacterium YX66]